MSTNAAAVSPGSTRKKAFLISEGGEMDGTLPSGCDRKDVDDWVARAKPDGIYG